MLLLTALSARTTNDLRERGQRGRRHTPGGRRSARPRLETLENRTLLSVDIVTNNSDDPSNLGSLRYAVDSAANGDTIEFASNVTGTITLSATNGPLDITQDLDIEGPGANNLTISGNDATEVFEVESGATATIAGLTIADGSANQGGGINNAGSLTVTNSTLSGNSAPGAFRAGGTGGGIDNIGTLTVTNSTLSDNSSTDETDADSTIPAAGGGINNFGTLTVTNSTLSDNSADYGGGIENVHTLALINCTVSGNLGSESGGGIYNYRFGVTTLGDTIIAANTAATGPDVDGPVTSLGYNLIGNPAGGSGFVATDLFNVDPLEGPLNPLLGPLQNNGGPTETMALLPGSPAIDAGNAALAVDANGNPLTTDQRGAPRDVFGGVDIGAFEVQVYQVSFTTDSGGGSLRSAMIQANQYGGGIIAFSTSGVIDLASPLPAISDDVQILGPGANVLTVSGYFANQVFVVNSGVTATIAGLTIADGTSARTGGGIDNDGTLTVTNSALLDNSAMVGGGIYNFGTLTVTNSTLSGNSAELGGGGIANGGTLTVTNSTISDNSGNLGGGIYNGSMLTVTDSTLAGNSASVAAGGIATYFGTMTMANTIIATNTAPSGPDLLGTVTSEGYNLIGNSSGGSGFVAADLLNVNPLLGPLQNNGGPTQTMALLPGSPAIGAGSVALIPAGITTDQRGFARTVNGTVDIGAFESPPGPAAQLVIHTQPSATATAGQALAVQPVIYEEDASGHLDMTDNSTQVTASLESGSGTLLGTTTVTVHEGIATFTNLADNTAGTISLSFASVPAHTSAISSNITISPAQPSQLVIHTQPSATASTGQPFPTQPVIYEEDQFGNLETGDNTTQVTASLRVGTGPLLGMTTVTVARGIATFTNLVDNTAESIILLFTGPGLAKATSNPITITDPPKAQVVIGSAKANAKVKLKETSRAKSRHAIGGDSRLTTTKTHARLAATLRPGQSKAVPARERSSLETVSTANRASAVVRADAAPLHVRAKLKRSLVADLIALHREG